MKKHTEYLGEIRELSWDSRTARPLGQTAAEIKSEARTQARADRKSISGWALDPVSKHILYAHEPRSDRFWLLRFLNLNGSL